ncbi:MAG: enoyl-CoA hydratase, partial [Betaproteobacteria bacterium]|nr:enoyl-CoA hydratase [Betaproteobacteria bacterium]
MSELPALKNAALKFDNRVATLTFQRDDVRNALTGTEIANDIVTTLEWANACADVSVLIMTGEGSAFSAGGNIKNMAARAKESPHILAQYYKYGVQRIPLAMQAVEIPVIAAVNGPAIGA